MIKEKIAIKTRDDYHKYIREIRSSLRKPYMDEMIEKFFGRNLTANQYKKMHGSLKNYLQGNSFQGGYLLNLHERVVDFYYEKLAQYEGEEKQLESAPHGEHTES